MCLDLHHLPYASLPAHMEEQGRGGRRTPGSPLPRPGGGDSKWAGGPGSHAKEAPRSTTGSPVSPSMYGLRTPQRLGAGRVESRVGEGVKEAQDRWGTGADPGEPLDPHPTPARPISLLHLDSILVIISSSEIFQGQSRLISVTVASSLKPSFRRKGAIMSSNRLVLGTERASETG